MNATDILMHEHRLIEQVLDCLEEGAYRLEDGAQIAPDFFIDAAQFVMDFADGRHHKKEEDILFVAMTARDMPGDSGPVAVMLHEHEQGRQFTAGFRSAAEQLNSGDTQAAAQVIRNVLDYVNLLREHIFKEDNVLFPMAEQLLSVEEMQEVSRQFDHLMAEDEAKGLNARRQALMDRLKHTLSAHESVNPSP